MQIEPKTDTKGSAYIFVLIIMMTVFLMLTVSLSVTDYESKITSVYSDYSNLYSLSVSGVEKMNGLLNRELERYNTEISKLAWDKVKAHDFSNIVTYKVTTLDNPYEGAFHLKLPGELYEGKTDVLYRQYFAEAADTYILPSLGSVLAEESGRYYFDYTIAIEEGNNQLAAYHIEVWLKADGTTTSPQYRVTTITTCLDTRAEKEVVALISISALDHTEIIKPEYRWQQRLFWVDYGTVAWGDILFDENVTNLHGISNQTESFVFDGVFEEQVQWELKNPILFIKDGSISHIDISDFYDGNEPVYTAVINTNDSPLYIETSDSTKNIFNGVVFSKGDILLTDVHVNGSLLSERNITLASTAPEPVHIRPDQNSLLKIKFADLVLQRKMLDTFGATNFHSLVTAETGTPAAMEKLLGKLAIVGVEGLELKGEKEMEFVITKLN